MKKKTEKTSKKRSRCASRTTLSELKQLHKDLRECLEVFKAEINQLADNIDEVCQSMSGKMEEGLQEYKEKGK